MNAKASGRDPRALWRERLDFLRAEEAIVADPAQKFALAKEIEEAEYKLAQLEAESSRDVGAPATRIEIGHLPTPGREFLGRDDELAWLDQAWADPQINAMQIVAWGGVGKSALVRRWLTGLGKDDWRGARRVFGWSFYSQGGGDDRMASADQFIDRALRFFSDEAPEAGSPRDKGIRLAGLVREAPTLLVLDGLEPLQHPPGMSFDAGRVKEPGLAALLTELATSMEGLCVVTTREAVYELDAFEGETARRIDLKHLDSIAAAGLLKRLGVEGTDEELRQAAEEVEGHALTLKLLGTYLVKACGRDVRRRTELDLADVDAAQGAKAAKLVDKYIEWLGEGPAVSALRLMGLFDRPAAEPAFAALRAEPEIPGLTDGLVGLSSAEWSGALSTLRNAHLLAPEDSRDTRSLDAHPIVRARLGERLEKEAPEAWREGHRRLFEHYRQTATEFPETLVEMSPLFLAVPHGCKAGLVREALNDVYRTRIQHGNQFYCTNELGALGSELACLGAFFSRRWSDLLSGLSVGNTAYVFGSVGFRLRGSGRLQEALDPTERAYRIGVRREKWENAAIDAGNLSELHLTLGSTEQAIKWAEEAVSRAQQSGSECAKRRAMMARACLAEALHLAGRVSESLELFRLVEKWQDADTKRPLLFSVFGFRFCDLLLEMAHLTGADSDDEEARYALEIAEISLDQHRSLLDSALAELVIARCRLTLDGAGPGTTEQLDRAVEGIRRAGREDHLPRTLCKRAECSRQLGDEEGATADLESAIRIAERSGMRLFECDAHLEWTRLDLATGDRIGARSHLDRAKQLIAECGYHKCDPQVEVLEAALAQAEQAG